ncbi:MAG TPA: alpha/beta hydrolase [Thermomicrobiales bacterium]|nr:alpha/beta hydrolase [Thermomicrobiales bacterium]
MASTDIRADTIQHPDAAPPTRHLPVAGGTIAYDDVGTGPAVIAVPSIGDVRAEYRFLRPPLRAAGFRVVTMDLRGHGESSVGFADYSSAAIGADILALARHLGAGPVAVIGTSKAGGAAVWAAAEAPDLVDRLVLISPFVRAHGNDAVMKAMMGVLLARPWGAAFWTTYFPKFYPSRQPADFAAYRAHLKTNLGEAGRTEALRAMVKSPGDVTAALRRVAAPTLVVMGSRDPDFKAPEEEAAWIAQRVNGTSLVVEGAGHYPHAELPERVAPAIVGFLAAKPGHPGT